jgi:hypothetical protein
VAIHHSDVNVCVRGDAGGEDGRRGVNCFKSLH